MAAVHGYLHVKGVVVQLDGGGVDTGKYCPVRAEVVWTEDAVSLSFDGPNMIRRRTIIRRPSTRKIAV